MSSLFDVWSLAVWACRKACWRKPPPWRAALIAHHARSRESHFLSISCVRLGKTEASSGGPRPI